METDSDHKAKIALRRQLRDRLAEMPVSARAAANDAIARRLATVSCVTAAPLLLVYVSTPREVATHQLICQRIAGGKRVCVPHFDGTTQQYVTAELREFGELVKGKFGIGEPGLVEGRVVPIESIDALLVPGLAFDRSGNRLGRGLGFFDRILRVARGIKIALAYEFQLVNEVPTEAHDARVDLIVTETRIVHCQRTDQ